MPREGVVLRHPLIGLMIVLMLVEVAVADVQAAAVQFQQPLQFVSVGGDAVVVPPGRYRVDAARKGLRVMAADGKAVLVSVMRPGRHKERIVAPVARLMSGKDGQYTLLLLSPDGRLLKAQAVMWQRQRPRRVAAGARPLPAVSVTASSPSLASNQKPPSSPPTGDAMPSRKALAQRVQSLEQQLNALLSVIAVNGGNVAITASSLSLQADDRLTIEAGAGGGLSIMSSGDLRIDAAKDLDARAGAVLRLNGAISSLLAAGGSTRIEGGGKLELDASAVFLGSARAANPVARVGSMTMTGIGGGPGSVTTGSPSVFVE